MKIHFNAQGTGLYKIDYAECGITGIYRKSWGGFAHGEVKYITTDPKEVTCERCKKTKAWKEAIR